MPQPLHSAPGAVRNDRLALVLLTALAMAVIPIGAAFAAEPTIADTGQRFDSPASSDGAIVGREDALR